MKRFWTWLRSRSRVLAAAADPRHALGYRGEEHVADHYRRAGYTIVARRWRSPFGEVDLIVERISQAQRCEVVAVEVKTRTARRRDGLDDPVAETNARQLERVERALVAFASRHRRRRRRGAAGPLLRVDLAAVIVQTATEVQLRVFSGRAFEAPRTRKGTRSKPEAAHFRRR